MNTVLVVFFLGVRSSYTNNAEQEATDEEFDTIQFFSSESGAWRIKTFAIDQDVHVWSIGPAQDDIAQLAIANTQQHYGDVLTEGYVIEVKDGLKGVRRELKKRGLPPNLETSEAGFAFWAPEGTEYRTKSQPKEGA